MTVVAAAREVPVHRGHAMRDPGAGEDAGNDFDHQRECKALGAGKRKEGTFVDFPRIGDRGALCIDCKTLRQRLIALDVFTHG